MRSQKQKPVKVLSSKVEYVGRVFRVLSDEIIEPNGVRARRNVVRHCGSVVILPVETSGSQPRVLLERQYRYAAGQYMWELPAGKVDAGEETLAAGKRELLEETGYSAKQWRRILHFYVSPGFLDETMTIYLAQGLSRGIATPEADEVIYNRMFSLSAAVQMVMRGTIQDAKTISGLLWLEKVWKQGGLKTASKSHTAKTDKKSSKNKKSAKNLPALRKTPAKATRSTPGSKKK